MREMFLMAFVAVAACSTTTSPPDAGPTPDRPPALDRPAEASATADSDGDGVCDLTEQMRRTDPRRVDTDGDGLIDSFELRIGADPLSGRSPAASDRVLFREGSASFATVEHLFEYRGTGDVVSATTLDRTAGVDGARASDLWDFSAEATSASPQAFVRALAGARFIGVLGMVVLRWRLTATPRATPTAGVRATLGCRRAYETQLVVKREGDEILDARPIVVELAPAEGDGGAPEWPTVSAEGHCLPARCF